MASGIVLAVVGGALLTALVGAVLAATSLQTGWVASSILPLAVALGLRARRLLPAPVPEVATESSVGDRALRIVAVAFLAVVAVPFLWANLIRPPILAGAIFDWSAPARFEPAAGVFPHALSSVYYRMAASDLGWKLIQVFLGMTLLPALYGLGVAAGLTRAKALLAAVAPLTSLSLLFWASSGYPDVFFTACIVLAVTLTLKPQARVQATALIPFSVLVWTGPFWAMLAALGILLARRAETAIPAWLAGGAVVVFGGWWLAGAGIEWNRVPALAAYLGRDLFNPARYGVLGYATLASTLALASPRRAATWLGVPLLFALVCLQTAVPSELAPELAVRFDGNRLLSAGLVLMWALALANTDRPSRAQSREEVLAAELSRL